MDAVNLTEFVKRLGQTEIMTDLVFKFVCRKTQDWKTVNCHRLVLAAISPVLKDCLLDCLTLNEDTVIISEWGSEVVDILYTGQTKVSTRACCCGMLLQTWALTPTPRSSHCYPTKLQVSRQQILFMQMNWLSYRLKITLATVQLLFRSILWKRLRTWTCINMGQVLPILRTRYR